MPRHAKLTKIRRDRSMLAGIKKHSARLDEGPWPPHLPSPSALAARFQAHLDSLDTVSAKEAAWRMAIRKEERLEEEMKDLASRTRLVLIALYGPDSPALIDFGIKRKKPIKIGAEKMLRTIEKRNATRKARHTMGKRQRKAIKGSR